MERRVLITDHVEFEVSAGNKTAMCKCDKGDLPLVYAANWALDTAGKYVRGWYDGKRQLFHRLVCPTDETVDHINRDTLDNRRANLRPASLKVQAINKVGRATKELPPGIVLQEDSYIVLATDIDAAISYSFGRYGDDLALKKALDTRLEYILRDKNLVEALLPEVTIKETLTKCSLPPDGSLKALIDAKFDFWRILYGGDFAGLSANNSRRACHQLLIDGTLSTIRKRMHSLAGDDEALVTWKEAVLKATEEYETKINATKGVTVTPPKLDVAEGEKAVKIETMLGRMRETLEKSSDEKVEKMISSMATRAEHIVTPVEKVEKKKKEWADDPTDSVGKWMEERCDRKGRVATTEAYENYDEWLKGKTGLRRQGVVKFNYFIAKKGIEKETKVTFKELRLK
jgi:hypothetical protein